MVTSGETRNTRWSHRDTAVCIRDWTLGAKMREIRKREKQLKKSVSRALCLPDTLDPQENERTLFSFPSYTLHKRPLQHHPSHCPHLFFPGVVPPAMHLHGNQASVGGTRAQPVTSEIAPLIYAFKFVTDSRINQETLPLSPGESMASIALARHFKVVWPYANLDLQLFGKQELFLN